MKEKSCLLFSVISTNDLRENNSQFTEIESARHIEMYKVMRIFTLETFLAAACIAFVRLEQFIKGSFSCSFFGGWFVVVVWEQRKFSLGNIARSEAA